MFALLLRRDASVYANAHHNNARYSLTPRTDNTRHAKAPGSHQHREKLGETAADKSADYLLRDKVEDEDTSSFFTRKYKLLAKFYLIFSAVFLLSFLHRRIKTAPVLCGLLSDRYIVQRVLRI
ncbi:hypothetical protein ACFOTA_14120 [Chitinophaga sp. GCM10012297]|uniref:Uncharacterized protein n=1 Tax=Chitinophaga chungangae TaxID=2821488 RepID=A0ABS3YGB1_9BACT|nr:hypothetical protein [Chitinophaga chungangae]MBO9153353.1 hypothetical protein [Chitinophaga chungangae]